MTLRRSPMPRPTKPLAAMSASKRAERAAAGDVSPTSTLAATSPSRKPAMHTKAPVKRPRYTPAVPKDTRADLIKRSGGLCEIQMTGCLGRGTDPSHRITSKAGGRHGAAKVEHDRLSDVLWACRSCHDWIGNHPAASKAEHVGWALEEWQKPTECPALYRGRLVFLDDLGGIHDYEKGAA